MRELKVMGGLGLKVIFSVHGIFYSIPIRDSNRFDSIRYANRFESIRFVKKIGLSIH